MQTAASLATLLIALLQSWILILEMFFWTRPLGKRTFRLSDEFAAASRVLAANQGLYNGFLAAGLFWGLWLGAEGGAVRLFFLGCVLTAGIFGAATVGRKILFVQGLPAAVALLLVALAGQADGPRDALSPASRSASHDRSSGPSGPHLH